jgi:hypothetical protein
VAKVIGETKELFFTSLISSILNTLEIISSNDGRSNVSNVMKLFFIHLGKSFTSLGKGEIIISGGMEDPEFRLSKPMLVVLLLASSEDIADLIERPELTDRSSRDAVMVGW